MLEKEKILKRIQRIEQELYEVKGTAQWLHEPMWDSELHWLCHTLKELVTEKERPKDATT